MFLFSQNLAELRKKRGVTQDELAEFIGVTKASVSKWENGQSMPDIQLLPLLASYFNVTIDELVGYQAQLSKEQIRAAYQSFSAAFAERPFDEVMEESRKMVKKYYSCYPFLVQICVLWLNHSIELTDKEKQLAVWEEMKRLCRHISANCRDEGLCNNVRSLQAMIDLQSGKPQEVIESLEEILSPIHCSFQDEGLLTQAYQMTGQKERAEQFTQMMMYLHLLSLLSLTGQYLCLHTTEPEKCTEAIRRTDALVETYQLKKLNPNAVSNYEFQAALMYCIRQQPEQALARLSEFADCCMELLDGPLSLREDAFFDRISVWFEELLLGNQAPRDRRKVVESIFASLEHPLFASLAPDPRFVQIKNRLYRLKD